MTKTETQIAQENVKEFKNPFPDGIEGNPWTNKIREGLKRDLKEVMQTHKATCQRFLEFLESYGMIGSKFQGDSGIENEKYKEKITDLKQAIKSYGDAGI